MWDTKKPGRHVIEVGPRNRFTGAKDARNNSEPQKSWPPRSRGGYADRHTVCQFRLLPPPGSPVVS
jgi:hypothetical protein